MLVIRLARGGRAKYPTYRIVAAESSRAATGKFVEILGHYNPHTKELVIKKEETERRLNHGAQPSNTVVKLLQRENITLPSWVKLKTKAPKQTEEATADDQTTEVTEAEAEAEVADDVEEAETPVEDEARVAEAATKQAAENEDNAVPMGETETAETTEAQAEKAEAASEGAAEAAEAPEADKQS